MKAALLTVEIATILSAAQGGALCELSQNTLRIWLCKECNYMEKKAAAVVDGEDRMHEIEYLIWKQTK